MFQTIETAACQEYGHKQIKFAGKVNRNLSALSWSLAVIYRFYIHSLKVFLNDFKIKFINGLH